MNGAYIHIHVHMYAPTHPPTHTHTYTNACAFKYLNKLLCAYMNAYVYGCISHDVCSSSLVQMQAQMQTPLYKHPGTGCLAMTSCED